jgi:HlyD family secretion protein
MSPPRPALDDLRIERTAKPDAPPRRLFIAVSVMIVLAAAGVFWWLGRAKAVEVRTAAAREVTRAASAERTVLNASGYVTARRQATVSSKVTGKVTEVLIEEGMAATEGQVLARIDDTNVRTNLRLAEAQVGSARAALQETRVRLKEAEQERQRQASLIKNNVAPQSDYDHAEATALAQLARLEQLQAEVAVAERSVAIWQQQLDDTVIRAPFSGIVTSKNAQPGEMISPMSAGGSFTRTGICTIVDMDSREIEIDVNESYINRVQPGQPVEATLDAYPEWKIPCRVIAIIPTADRQKSTVRVRVGFVALDPRILPEMSVKVAFHETAVAAGGAPAAGRNARVPKSALRQREGRDVVLVVRSGRVERRAVTVAGTTAEDTELSAGLAAGERVVIEGPVDLTDGALVKEMIP